MHGVPARESLAEWLHSLSALRQPSTERARHGAVSLAMQRLRAGRQTYRFSVLVGTIFENTNKPLRVWFCVMHLMLTSKKGMSALQIMRYMGFGSYKIAWLM